MKDKQKKLNNDTCNQRLSKLNAISPLDGRYASSENLKILRNFLSESALIFHRLKVEITWLIFLSEAGLPELKPFSNDGKIYLYNLAENFSESDISQIKDIEKVVNHDVKAVEYWLKEKLLGNFELRNASEFVHFACTSDDINSVSYALMLLKMREFCIVPCLNDLVKKLENLAIKNAEQSMLSRTHGQPASPTTLGKEFANFSVRLRQAIDSIISINPTAKLNGATGNYNAHVLAYPEIDWPGFSKSVLDSLGIIQNKYTTQIEPHDWMCCLFDAIARLNNIVLDLNRDIWGYFSLGYFFSSNLKTNEIGSSTMPHKINPIDFENSEGNLGLANSILRHMADKLPVSRWQRDLTDSTVLRNIGVALGHCLLAWESCSRGLFRLGINREIIDNDLDQHWEVLAEPIQTVMRRYGFHKPYEQLKSFTRGKNITKTSIHEFIHSLKLPLDVKKILLEMTPRNYIGIAVQLAKSILA